MEKFNRLGLTEDVTDVLRELKFKEPTEIQEQTIPLILEGKDIIGIASTGSGKTFAFAAGIIKQTVAGEGVQSLVLAPTRELAEQITKVMRVFAERRKLSIVEVYGGVSINEQIVKIRGADVVIGTPGRILDHLSRETINFSKIKVLVLDEADRMVDMGFLPDVEEIIRHCAKNRQTLMFSATTSTNVTYIAKKYMKDAIHIGVEQYVDASKLKQIYYDTPVYLKFSLLAHFLKQERKGIVMVFCNTRRNVDLLTMNLKKYKIKASAIHGGLEQNRRSKIMEQFHNNEADILICTDVAARGLDIKGVTYVYNYDIPKNSEEYIHRVGRTARAGEKGIAVSLVSEKDYMNFGKVVEDSSLQIENKELPEFEKLSPDFRSDRDSRGSGNRGGGNFRGGGSRGGSYGGQRGGSSRGGSSYGGNRGSSYGGQRDRGYSRDSSRGSSRSFGGNRRR